MAIINQSSREINAKIVFYGPGRSGKTTNIQYVHAKLKQAHKGELMTLATEGDRTLFFDFLPVDLGEVKGMQVRFHLYTVPGQVFYNSTRKLVLKNADAVVFVADSERRYLNENLDSFRNLEENLKAHGRTLTTVPVILQYNKRDTEGAVPVAELNQLLNKRNFPVVEAVASKGEGVLQTLTLVSKLVIRSLREAEEAAAAAPQPAAASEFSSSLGLSAGVSVPAAPAVASAPESLEVEVEVPAAESEEDRALSALGTPPPAPAPRPAPSFAPAPPPAAPPARPSFGAAPSAASAAAPGVSPGPQAAGLLEFVKILSRSVSPTGELRITLELKDPKTGRIYLAPVKVNLDLGGAGR